MILWYHYVFCLMQRLYQFCPFPSFPSAFSACRTGVLSAHFLCRLHFGKSHKQIAHTSKREVSWIWNITKVSVGLQLDRSEWAFGFETFRWGWFWLSCHRKGDPNEGTCLTNNHSVAEFWRAPPTSRPAWCSPAAMRTRLTPLTTSSSFQLLFRRRLRLLITGFQQELIGFSLLKNVFRAKSAVWEERSSRFDQTYFTKQRFDEY